jgi:hypothetical protein
MYTIFKDFFETIHPQMNPDFFDQDNTEQIKE